MKLEPWQRAIVLRESRRLEQFVRRFRWHFRARIRAKLLEDLEHAFPAPKPPR